MYFVKKKNVTSLKSFIRNFGIRYIFILSYFTFHLHVQYFALNFKLDISEILIRLKIMYPLFLYIYICLKIIVTT